MPPPLYFLQFNQAGKSQAGAFETPALGYRDWLVGSILVDQLA